jgi:hypothetical protein
MADVLGTGVDWLLGTLAAHVSRTVIYRRGSSSASISVTLGQSEWENMQADGSTIRFVTRDYIYSQPTLTNFGLPQRGDEIVDSDGVYQVLPTGAMQASRYLDTRQKGLRIHTKKKDAA